METNRKWDLSKYYNNFKEWEKDYDIALEKIKELEQFKGRLESSLRKYLLTSEEIEKLITKLYRYASASDLNLRDTIITGYMARMYSLFEYLDSALSFEAPELLTVGEEKVISILESDAYTKTYVFKYKKLFEAKKHILSEVSEKIIANYSGATHAFSEIYQNLSIVDASDEKVILSDSREITVTLSNYRSFLTTLLDSNDRRLVFEAAFKRFASNKATYASIYSGILKAKRASYVSRNYKSALESVLDSNKIPLEVYSNLMDVAYENTEPVKRYIELRKKYFGLKEYHTYDRFLNLSYDDTKYSYENAKKMFFAAIDKFPKELKKAQIEALAPGYVDVDAAPGKRTGAYSSSFYDDHPFILLNHDETLDSVFTLAHEAGHSAHSILSNNNQPRATADYVIFVAEIASTFNEHLLLDQLLLTAKSKNEKITLLEKAIDNILGTFYRQTLFATYEYRANQLLEQNIPIDAINLSQIMKDLYKHYYDIDISSEKGKEFVWAYIPHLFRTPFYVYQYATSLSASLKFYENVKLGVAGAIDEYLKLLKAGGSDYPINLVAASGVDLTTKEAFMAVVNRLNDLIDQLEKILEI